MCACGKLMDSSHGADKFKWVFGDWLPPKVSSIWHLLLSNPRLCSVPLLIFVWQFFKLLDHMAKNVRCSWLSIGGRSTILSLNLREQWAHQQFHFHQWTMGPLAISHPPKRSGRSVLEGYFALGCSVHDKPKGINPIEAKFLCLPFYGMWFNLTFQLNGVARGPASCNQQIHVPSPFMLWRLAVYITVTGKCLQLEG